MDRVNVSLRRAEQALKSLQEVLRISDASEIERDASIQRFEFTFEVVWKTARHFLREVEGIDVASPKGAIRSSRETSLLTTAEAAQALVMADDRNLTSHTYDRELAMEIYQRLRGHADLMAVWLERISEGVSHL